MVIRGQPPMDDAGDPASVVRRFPEVTSRCRVSPGNGDVGAAEGAGTGVHSGPAADVRNDVLRRARERVLSARVPGCPLSRDELAERVNVWLLAETGETFAGCPAVM